MSSNKILEFLYEIKKLIPKRNEIPDMVYGEVVSINPLAVKIDENLTIIEEFLILGANVKETIIKVPVDHDFQHLHEIDPWETEAAGEGPHKHGIPAWRTKLAHPEIMLWRGLEVNDKVRMIRVYGGQRYFILERQEGITNDPKQD